jgi:HPt (histidine-containing phosphotransfer) domain-containing protein
VREPAAETGAPANFGNVEDARETFLTHFGSARLLQQDEPDLAPRGPIIDLVHLSRQTLGDQALEGELLRLFASQAEQAAICLKENLSPGDGPWRADLAHRLKGSGRAIGAFEFADAAEAFEEAARLDAPNLAQAQSHFVAAIERTLLVLAQLL